MTTPYPARRTLRLEVEVTIDEYDAAYDSRDLADDVREGIFAVLAENVPRDVVMMTVTAADEPPAPPADAGPIPATNTHRAIIENSCPPSVQIIASGPKAFCEQALFDWLLGHPLEEFDTPAVIRWADDVPRPPHEFTGTVKRADGVIITATLAVPETHPMAKPGPLRPWHGTAPRSNQNFLELGELAMMIAQRGYGIIESNERSREHWGRQDYWADLLNVTPPTPELER